MQRFKNILFFSNPSVKQDAAIRRAGFLAKQNDARLTILSVIKALPDELRVPVAGTASKELQTQIIHERQIQAERVANDFRQERIDAHSKLVTGAAFVEVIREVLREQHDLVILAADGKRSVITRLFGSTSMHLMRKCPCPVWVVKPGAGKSYNRILAAIDTTNDPWDDSKQPINPLILQLASSLARIEKSDLHVVQVWSVVHEAYLQARGGLSDRAVRRLRKDTKRDYLRKLDFLMKGCALDGIGVVRSHLKRGDDPAPIIIKLARKEKIDLLVMGTVCRTGLAGFFIGNTAEEVLSAVDCSVLTVKPAGFVSPVTLEGQ